MSESDLIAWLFVSFSGGFILGLCVGELISLIPPCNHSSIHSDSQSNGPDGTEPSTDGTSSSSCGKDSHSPRS